jgi:hypothetical protein
LVLAIAIAASLLAGLQLATGGGENELHGILGARFPT